MTVLETLRSGLQSCVDKFSQRSAASQAQSFQGRKITCDKCRADAMVRSEDPILNTLREVGRETRQVRAGTRYNVYCPNCGPTIRVILCDSNRN
jgi:Zn finger protein HypA/HybF involved in hydrogenase expression